MKDYLLDLVHHTVDLGCIDLVKIVGTTDSTKIVAMAEDQSVVLLGAYHSPFADFVGTFGMPNLNKLRLLLNLAEYRDNAKISIKHRDDGEPEALMFANQTDDFHNSYRFMSSDIVKEMLRTPRLTTDSWHVEFEPSVTAIQRLKMQSQANPEQTNFTAKTQKHDLVFQFGDHSTHAGHFVFYNQVDKAMKNSWSWPVAPVNSILSSSGNKIMRITDGAMQITVDSGQAVYNYTLPALTK